VLHSRYRIAGVDRAVIAIIDVDRIVVDGLRIGVTAVLGASVLVVHRYRLMDDARRRIARVDRARIVVIELRLSVDTATLAVAGGHPGARVSIVALRTPLGEGDCALSLFTRLHGAGIPIIAVCRYRASVLRLLGGRGVLSRLRFRLAVFTGLARDRE
jgi:hypothetical protein